MDELAAGARLTANYLALVAASCAIATFGLLENSAAVIIGAMIVAPLMSVIQAIAFGALQGSVRTMLRGAVTLAVGVVGALLFAALLSRAVGITEFGSEILGRTRPTLLDLGIALAAGAIGAFARVRSEIANTLAGTAIAVALMPPLCVAGIGIASADWSIARGAALLFVTNLFGITLASMVVFFLAGVEKKRAGTAIAWTVGLTALIAVPLAYGFETLAREAALQSALRTALATQTVTFRHAQLVDVSFDWLSSPPVATLLVRSATPISPHEVALLEAFAQRKTGQKFRLVLDVAQYQTVTAPLTGGGRDGIMPQVSHANDPGA